MNRILRIEARRSTAPVIVVGVVAISAASTFLFGSRQSWGANWMAMAGAQRNMLPLFAAFAAGAGAWYAGRDRGAVADLVVAAPRPRWQRLLPALVVLGAAAALAYLLAFALGAAVVAPVASYLDPAAVAAVTAVGALAMLVAAWLGFTAGQLVRSRLTAPLVTIVLPAILVVGSVLGYRSSGRGSNVSLLQPMLDTPWSATYTVPGTVSAVQALWFVALAAAAALAVCAARRTRRVLALLPVVVAATVVVPHLDASSVERQIGYVVDPEAAAPVCAEGAPKVCVARANAALLPQVTAPARAAIARLACLPDPPTTAAESVYEWDPPDRGTLWMSFDSTDAAPDGSGTLPPAQVRDLETYFVDMAVVNEDRGPGPDCPLPAASAAGSRG
ncbi:MAG: hypothetical protein ACRCYR_20825 [Phycicoccus sp.]